MSKLLTVLLVLAGIAFAAQARAELRVFACEPEWAALTALLAGERASITTAVAPTQDAHYLRARPSFIAAARRADLLVCTGAGLEEGWLPILLRRGSASIQPGEAGHLMVAEHLPLMDVPDNIDRSQGHLHPQGNPHISLDPGIMPRAASLVAERLRALDPEAGDHYERALASFQDQWGRQLAQWRKKAAPLTGKALVAHHGSWRYTARWLGMEIAALLEPKPGVAPTPSHLQGLARQLAQGPRPVAIIRAPFEPAGASEWLEDRLGVPALVLPFAPEGEPGLESLSRLYDRQLDALLQARASAGEQ